MLPRAFAANHYRVALAVLKFCNETPRLSWWLVGLAHDLHATGPQSFHGLINVPLEYSGSVAGSSGFSGGGSQELTQHRESFRTNVASVLHAFKLNQSCRFIYAIYCIAERVADCRYADYSSAGGLEFALQLRSGMEYDNSGYTLRFGYAREAPRRSCIRQDIRRRR